MSHTQSDENPDEHSLFPFIITLLTDDRGQTQFCNNLIANLFEQGIIPCKTEFPEIKIKRQIVDHYLKGICNLTQQYGICTIELSTPSKIHGRYVIQTDEKDMNFQKYSQNTLKTYSIKIHKERTQYSPTNFLH